MRLYATLLIAAAIALLATPSVGSLVGLQFNSGPTVIPNTTTSKKGYFVHGSRLFRTDDSLAVTGQFRVYNLADGSFNKSITQYMKASSGGVFYPFATFTATSNIVNDKGFFCSDFDYALFRIDFTTDKIDRMAGSGTAGLTKPGPATGVAAQVTCLQYDRSSSVLSDDGSTLYIFTYHPSSSIQPSLSKLTSTGATADQGVLSWVGLQAKTGFITKNGAVDVADLGAPTALAYFKNKAGNEYLIFTSVGDYVNPIRYVTLSTNPIMVNSTKIQHTGYSYGYGTVVSGVDDAAKVNDVYGLVTIPGNSFGVGWCLGPRGMFYLSWLDDLSSFQIQYGVRMHPAGTAPYGARLSSDGMTLYTPSSSQGLIKWDLSLTTTATPAPPEMVTFKPIAVGPNAGPNAGPVGLQGGGDGTTTVAAPDSGLTTTAMPPSTTATKNASLSEGGDDSSFAAPRGAAALVMAAMAFASLLAF